MTNLEEENGKDTILTLLPNTGLDAIVSQICKFMLASFSLLVLAGFMFMERPITHQSS